jgi:hypothetical protein
MMNWGALFAAFACVGFALGAGCMALTVKHSHWRRWVGAGVLAAMVGLIVAPVVYVFSCGIEFGCCHEKSILCVFENYGAGGHT